MTSAWASDSSSGGYDGFGIAITRMPAAFAERTRQIRPGGLKRRDEKHRRIAKWTMPIWLYVSITGVLVYLMLYQWFPPASLALGQ